MPDAPVKLCECGCGKPTGRAKITDQRRGIVAGEPNRFLPGHYSRVGHRISEAELKSRCSEVAREHLAGKSLNEIATSLGLRRMQVHSDVVALRRSGVLPPARKCKAITGQGRRCRSSAGPNGFCGGHGSNKSGRPRSNLPVPVEVLAERYTSGETIDAIAADVGIGRTLLINRLKEAGVAMRPRGCVKGSAPWNHKWLKTDEILSLWDGGLSLCELAERFGISTSTIWGRIVRTRGSKTAQQIKRLYVDEELPLRLVAEFMGCSEMTVLRRLRALGIEQRNGRNHRRHVAEKATIRQIQRASEARAPLDSTLTDKQALLLNVLRASPEPLSARRVRDVCRGFPNRWSMTVSCINACFRRLEVRGYVDSTVDRGAGHYRGRKVLIWFPATKAIAAATSPDDAKRLREIQVLVEEQEREAQGEWGATADRGHWADRSLDAPLTEDGFTILDTLGRTDEALEEIHAYG